MPHDNNYDEYSPEMQKKITDFIKSGKPSVPYENSISIFQQPPWADELQLTPWADKLQLMAPITPQRINSVEIDGKTYRVKPVDIKIHEHSGLSNQITITTEYKILREEEDQS